MNSSDTKKRVGTKSGAVPVSAPKANSGLMAALALALFSFLVYLPALRCDFVNYDDPDYVTSNRHVSAGLSLENVRWAFTTGHASNWHPLTWLSHMLDTQLWGTNAMGHHLTSMLLHSINVLLLFLAMRSLTGTVWRSWFVAACFALHPLHAESVAWISERKDVLSAFFFLLTLLAYSAFARTTGRRSWLLYGASLLSFALGLASKPMLVTVPFVLLLLDYWPLSRWPGGGQDRNLQACARLLLEKVPFLALSLASSIVTYLVQEHGGAVSMSLSFGDRLSNALISYIRYLWKTILPHNLSVLYPHPGSWPAAALIASVLVLVAISVLVFRARAGRPWLLVGWLWFVGMLVPVIGIVQVGIQSMADRYTYLPLVGVFFAVIWEVAAGIARRPALQPAGRIIVFTLLAVWALLTSQQTRYWRDSETLFRHVVKATKNNYLAYNNLGLFLANKGQTAEALQCYQRALQINPAYHEVLNNVGFLLAGQGRFSEALPYYEAALRVARKNVEIRNNYGNALSELGRGDEALAQYEFVLREDPTHADAHNNLGIALATRGRVAEAIPHFLESLRYKPNNAGAHSNLGNSYASQQKWEAAIEEYKKALQLNPKEAQVHNNLANVLSAQGQLQEAVSHYEQAISLNPRNPEACFNLAICLSRMNRRHEAVSYLERALQLKPDYAQARRQLELLNNP